MLKHFPIHQHGKVTGDSQGDEPDMIVRRDTPGMVPDPRHEPRMSLREARLAPILPSSDAPEFAIGT